MADTTDSILAGLTAAALALCGITAFVSAWRTSRRALVMKSSRSDPDLESLQNIVTDSLPTHK